MVYNQWLPIPENVPNGQIADIWTKAGKRISDAQYFKYSEVWEKPLEDDPDRATYTPHGEVMGIFYPAGPGGDPLYPDLDPEDPPLPPLVGCATKMETLRADLYASMIEIASSDALAAMNDSRSILEILRGSSKPDTL